MEYTGILCSSQGGHERNQVNLWIHGMWQYGEGLIQWNFGRCEFGLMALFRTIMFPGRALWPRVS